MHQRCWRSIGGADVRVSPVANKPKPQIESSPLSYFVQFATALAIRLNDIALKAQPGSVAARLRRRAAADVALTLASELPADASDKQVIDALARLEQRRPQDFDSAGQADRPEQNLEQKLTPAEREGLAKMTAEQKLAMANRHLANAAKSRAKP